MSYVTYDLRCRVFATPSAATIIQDGVEIFSGQVGAGQPLDTEMQLVEITNVAPGTGLIPITITVTSGVLTIGNANKTFTQTSSGNVTQLDDDARISSSVLVNGVDPEWPATPVDPMPKGTQENPNWEGWFFEVSAGETITFNLDNNPLS